MAYAIDGSGSPVMSNAIDGSGSPVMANAIDGSGSPVMANAIDGSGLNLNEDSGFLGKLADSSLISLGQVEGVSADGISFNLLGQKVFVPGITGVNADSDAIQKGDFVAVFGFLAGAEIVDASQILVFDFEPVPGSTTLITRGVVTDTSHELGTLKLGGMTVDYTSAAHRGGFERVRPGDVLLFAGTMISSSNTFYAYDAIDGSGHRSTHDAIDGSGSPKTDVKMIRRTKYISPSALVDLP